MAEQVSDKPIEKIQEAASSAARAETEHPRIRRYRTILFQIALVLIVAAFAVLTFLVKAMPFFTLDLSITRAVQLISLPSFGTLMSVISWPGFGPQSFIITAVVILVVFGIGLRWEGVMTLVAAILTSAINVLVKDLVQRPRPASSMVHVFASLNSYSFPSGHVMYYLGFLGFLWFLAFTLLKPSVKRLLLLVFMGIFIALVGVSRVYLGEHWASDVLGSYLLGTLTLVAIIRIYLWGKTRFFVRQPVAPAAPGEIKKN